MTGFSRLDMSGCFGDERLGRRGNLAMEQMVEKGTCTLRKLGEGRGAELALGRFLANPNVTAPEIVAAAGMALGDRVAGLHVLAIQDTSEVNFERHAKRVSGLGPAGNGRDRGLFVHPVIAVEAESGALLGLAGAELWTRPDTPRQEDYRTLRIEDKESYRWVCGGERAKQVLSAAAHLTVIADRESDIYEEWARLPDRRCDLLTRVSRDRSLVGGGRLFTAADDWPERHRFKLALRAQPGRAARTAQVALRYGAVTIAKPGRCTDPDAPDSIGLYLVEVREIGATGKDAIHWRLLTTHVVDDTQTALRIVGWYRQRWNIEQVFRTLKRQGLDIEASQVTTAKALITLTAMATVAAVQIMQLVLARDGALERPATDVIAPEMIALAAALQHDLEGKTQAQKNPHPKGSLAWLAWIIARLGGWNGYKSERPPGPITMAYGWKQFHAIAQGWKLGKDV